MGCVVARLHLHAHISSGDSRAVRSNLGRASDLGTRGHRKALDQPAEFDFKKTPLAIVVDSLHTKYAIDVQLDEKALEEAGVAVDTPLTCQLKFLSVRSALRWMLSELDLTAVVRHDKLLITTTAAAENIADVVIYPVEDLILPPASVRQPGRHYQPDYDSLIEAIVSTIAPTRWREQTGPAPLHPYHGTLIVPQTQDVHADIATLLAQLRDTRLTIRAARQSRGDSAASNCRAPRHRRS